MVRNTIECGKLLQTLAVLVILADLNMAPTCCEELDLSVDANSDFQGNRYPLSAPQSKACSIGQQVFWVMKSISLELTPKFTLGHLRGKVLFQQVSDVEISVRRMSWSDKQVGLQLFFTLMASGG